jgi:hypothetical protein
LSVTSLCVILTELHMYGIDRGTCVCVCCILLSFMISFLSVKSYLNVTRTSHVVYQTQTSVMYSEGLEFFSECHQNSLCISRLPHFTCISSPSQPFVFLRFFNYTFWIKMVI